MLEDVAILVADTCRSRIYLQTLNEAELLPSVAILLDGANDKHLVKVTQEHADIVENRVSYNLCTPVEKLLRGMGIPTVICDSGDPNAEDTTEKILELPQKTVIYSGPIGVILKDTILGCRKKFIHVHPGRLPRFRGSTTVYYSLIKEGKAGASAFFMDREIDNGPLIMQRDFPAFEKPEAIDYFYDSYMRSQLLKEVLELYLESGDFATEEQSKSEETESYYVIHPILKSIAIYRKRE
jgi:methionyl-tRNA formyltransferase